VVLAAAVVAAIVLPQGGDGPSPKRPAPPPRTTHASVADPPIRVGTRPNGLTIAGGRVWALSGPSAEIDIVSPRTNDVARRVIIGADGKSLVGAFDSVWVLKGKTRSLLRRHVRTGGQVGPVVQIAYAGLPVQIVAGERALWVGVRTPDAVNGEETVVKIDPSTLAQQRIPIPGGVQDIAVGEGALWVSNRFSKSVLRVDARTGVQRAITLTGTPDGLATGAGAVWVATTDEDTITRISPRGLDVQAIPTPSIPTRVTVGGGSVWATALEAGRLLRIDPVRRKVVERIDTGSRPFALDVEHGRAVWVTLIDSGSVQRVRFSREFGR
jgi:streptogramin lyase